jgi:hypothetical protein
VSYDGPNRRRWWARPWRALYGAVREFGTDPPPTSRWHHIWRDFVPLAALVIATFAVVGLEDKVDDADVKAATARVEAATAKKLAATQTAGRKVSIGIICGALRGVEDAGRLVLTNRLRGRVRYRQPSTPREQRIRRIFARSYNRVITDRIVLEAGARGEEVIEPNGSVNCDKLREAAGTAEP